MQTEDGGFEPILPAADLEAIHGRILARELAVNDSGAAEQQPSSPQPRGAGPPLNVVRLAAALGLTPLLLPFRRGPVACCAAMKESWLRALSLPMPHSHAMHTVAAFSQPSEGHLRRSRLTSGSN